MLSRMALVAGGLQALMPSSVIGVRRAGDRKVALRNLESATRVRMARKYSAEFSITCPCLHGCPSMHRLSGCLLEWQRAQFSANTTLPWLSFEASMWDAPLGASLR